MPSFRPILDQVLIRRDKPDESLPGGSIVLSKGEQEDKMTGVVVAVGTGKELPSGHERPLYVAIGDRVLYKRFSGIEVPKGLLDEEQYVVVYEQDIAGIIVEAG